MNKYVFSSESKPRPDELLELFLQENWTKTRTIEEVEKLLDQTTIFYCVYRESKLVGFSRAISDGQYRALIEDVIVASSARNEGLGRKLMEGLMSQLAEVEQVFLNTGDSLEGFYQSFGFETFDGLTMSRSK